MLYDSEPVVQNVIDHCNDLINKTEGSSLLDFLHETETSEEHVAQLVGITATQLALAAFWTNIGISPTAVLGSNIGVIPACCFAGSISMEQAISLAADFARRDGDAMHAQIENIRAPQLMLMSTEANGVITAESDVVKLLEASCSGENAFANDQLTLLTDQGLDCALAIAPESEAVIADTERFEGDHESTIDVIQTVSAGKSDSLGHAVKRAYESGLTMELRGLFSGESRRKTNLPTYPFEHKKFWFDS